MTSGQIFIISNQIYSQYGSNVFMIGCSSNPDQTIDLLSTAFIQPFDIHFISSKVSDMNNLLSDIYDKLKYSRINQNKQLFMLPNLQMVQQMIMNLIVDLLPNQSKPKCLKENHKDCDIFIDDPPISQKASPVNKNHLDDDITDSDDEDIKTFNNLLTITDCTKANPNLKKTTIKKAK